MERIVDFVFDWNSENQEGVLKLDETVDPDRWKQQNGIGYGFKDGRVVWIRFKGRHLMPETLEHLIESSEEGCTTAEK